MRLKRYDIEIEELQLFNDYKFDFEESILESEQILKDFNVLGYDGSNFVTSPKWRLESKRLDQRMMLDFTKQKFFLETMTSNENTRFNIITRCWVASLIEVHCAETVRNYYYALIKFLELTKSLNILNPYELTNEFQEYSVYEQHRICVATNNLLDYAEDVFKEKSVEVYKLISHFSGTFKRPNNARNLPKTKDILIFNNVFDDFFNKKLRGNEYLKWMPVYFWWKITNIIPLRPSEFAQLDINCIFSKDEKYYLKIKRIKISQEQRSNNTLSEITIPKELFLEMMLYIKVTSKFEKRVTFLSYESIIHSFKLHNPTITRRKFTNLKFRKILNQFYEQIVFSKYKVSYKKNSESLMNIDQKLLPGDTRHLAFINLKRQGYHPVEIARIGGHTKLESQEHYFSHINNLIDLEVLSIISKADLNLSSITIDTSFIDKHILRFSNNNFQLKLRDGYCIDPEMNCRVNDCWECESWRISQEEFLEKKDLLEEKISLKRNELNEVLKSMKELYTSIYKKITTNNSQEIEHYEKSLLYKHAIQLDTVIQKYIDLKKIQDGRENNER